MNHKIAVVTNANLASSIVLSRVLSSYYSQITGVFFTTRYTGTKNNFSSALNILKTSGWDYLLFKIITNKILPWFVRKNILLSEKCKKYNIPLFYESHLNSDKSIRMLKNLNASVLLSVSSLQIFSEKVLEIFDSPVNVHMSLLPRYGGVSPYVWQMINDEKYAGFTIHKMNSIIDGGDIIVSEKILLNHPSSLSLLFELAFIGRDLLYDVVTRIINSEPIQYTPQNLSERTYFKHPSKRDIEILKKNGRRLWSVNDIRNVIWKVDNLYS